MAFALTQRAFRFYEDGTETGSVAIAAENTNITRLTLTNSVVQLRMGLQESGSGSFGGATTDDFQLQYSKNGGAFTNITNASSNIRGFNSASLTDAATTTNRLSAGTGSFVAGEISEVGLVTDRQVTANNFTELLYSLELVAADLANANTLDFRVLLNGATMTYSVTPRLTVSKAYTLTADSGAYAWSGTAATVKAARKIAADTAAVSITGPAATLAHGFKITASSGSVTETGTSAGLRVTRYLALAAGALLMVGTVAGLTSTRLLAAASGSTVWIGTAATLTYTPNSGGYTLTASPGSITETGTAATLTTTRRLSSVAGSCAVVGTPASLTATRTVSASAGSVSVTGTIATLRKGFGVTALPGGMQVTGSNAALWLTHVLAAQSGSWAITGTSVAFLYAPLITQQPAYVSAFLTVSSRTLGPVPPRDRFIKVV